MSTKAAFSSRRIPPVPEGFVESTAARARQKEDLNEEDESEEQKSSSPTLPLDNRIIPLGRQSSSPRRDSSPFKRPPSPLSRQLSLHDLAEGASLRDAETSSIPAREAPFADIPQIVIRSNVCIKLGKMAPEDLPTVLMWTMGDIDQNDEAMCERVSDLLGKDLGDEEVTLGDPFVAESFDGGISIVNDECVCGILITTEPGNPAKVRVGDLQNLKPQTEKYPIGYDEFDAASEMYRTSRSHVLIVRRNQQIVIEGKLTLRFFIRMPQGTGISKAKRVAELAWIRRDDFYDVSGPLWHEYFTK